MAKRIGYGSVIVCATDLTTTASSLMTSVGHLISWGGLDAPVPSVDVSNIADAHASQEPGQPEAGEGSFVLGYTQGDTGHRKLIAMRKNRTKGQIWLRAQGSTADEYEKIKCFVSNVGLPGFDKTNRVTRSISIQPTSAIGWSTA
jgi:hypothetical protein